MGRGAWWATVRRVHTVHRVSESWTQLKQLKTIIKRIRNAISDRKLLATKIKEHKF